MMVRQTRFAIPWDRRGSSYTCQWSGIGNKAELGMLDCGTVERIIV